MRDKKKTIRNGTSIEDTMHDFIEKNTRWNKIAAEDPRLKKLFRGETIPVVLKQTEGKELLPNLVLRLDCKNKFKKLTKRFDDKFFDDLLTAGTLLHAIRKRISCCQKGRINIDDILEVVQNNFCLNRDILIFHAICYCSRNWTKFERIEISTFADSVFQSDN